MLKEVVRIVDAFQKLLNLVLSQANRIPDRTLYSPSSAKIEQDLVSRSDDRMDYDSITLFKKEQDRFSNLAGSDLDLVYPFDLNHSYFVQLTLV